MASGSGWNLWVWLVGVVVRRYIYRFPSYYLSLLLLFLFFFAAASLLSLFIKKNVFRSCSSICFVIKFYVLNNVFT